MRGGFQVLLPLDLHGGVEQHLKQSGQGFETLGGQLPQKCFGQSKLVLVDDGCAPESVVTSRILPDLLLLSRARHFYRNDFTLTARVKPTGSKGAFLVIYGIL